MKHLYAPILLLPLMLLFQGCTTPVRVRPVSADEMKKSETEGKLYYALPRTIIDVECTQVTDVVRRGPFYDHRAAYAEFLGLEEESPEDKKRWDARPKGADGSVTNIYADPKTLVVSTRQIPDKWYAVDLEVGLLETRKIELQLDESGLISKGGSESENHVLPFLAETAKFAGRVVASVGGLGRAENDDLKEKHELLKKLEEERKKLVEKKKSPKNILKKDKAITSLKKEIEDKLKFDVLDEIDLLRKSKRSLLTKEYIQNPDVLTKQLSLLQEAEDRLIAKFDYEVVSRQQQKVWSSFNPVNTDSVVSADGMLKLVIKNETNLPYFVPKAKEAEASTVASFFYRIPKSALFEVQFKTTNNVYKSEYKRIGEKRLNVCQFGEIHHLPGDSNAAALAQSLEFHGNTGAIKLITSSQKPVDSAAVYENLGSGIESMIKAEQENSDGLESMKREIEIIETREKLNSLRAKSNPPTDAIP